MSPQISPPANSVKHCIFQSLHNLLFFGIYPYRYNYIKDIRSQGGLSNILQTRDVRPNFLLQKNLKIF